MTHKEAISQMNNLEGFKMWDDIDNIEQIKRYYGKRKIILGLRGEPCEKVRKSLPNAVILFYN